MRGRSLDHDPVRRAAPRGGSAMPSPPEERTSYSVKVSRQAPATEQNQLLQDPPLPITAPQWEHEAWVKRNGPKLPQRVAALTGAGSMRQSSGAGDDNPFVVRGTPPTSSSRSKERYTESPKAAEAALDPGAHHLSRRASSSQRASSLPVEMPSSGKSTPSVKTPVRGSTVPTTLPSQKLSPVGMAWDAVPALKSPPLTGSRSRALGPHRHDSLRDSNPVTPNRQRSGSTSEVSPAPAGTVKGRGEAWTAHKYSFPHQQSPYGKSKDSGTPLLSNSVDRKVIKPPEDSALFNSSPGDLVKMPQMPFGAAAPQDPNYWRLPSYERPVQLQMPPPRYGSSRLRAVHLPANYMTSFLEGIAGNRRAGLETVALLLGVLDKVKDCYCITTLLFSPQSSHPQQARITDEEVVVDYCERLGAEVVGV
ncbi:hypothetical protein DACRYDRAFT_22525, partial [Dacryopinax primogenitus]